MRFKLGRFGATKGGTKTPAADCGCSPTPIDRAKLLRRLALKAREVLTPQAAASTDPSPEVEEPEQESEQSNLSVFDRVCGVPIWLLEAEGWTPGEDPSEYFDAPLAGDRASSHDLTTTWYERLDLEYARMDEEGEPPCPSD